MIRKITTLILCFYITLSSFIVTVHTQNNYDNWKWVLIEDTGFDVTVIDNSDNWMSERGKKYIDDNSIVQSHPVYGYDGTYLGDAEGKATWTYPPREIPFGRENDFNLDISIEDVNVVYGHGPHSEILERNVRDRALVSITSIIRSDEFDYFLRVTRTFGEDEEDGINYIKKLNVQELLPYGEEDFYDFVESNCTWTLNYHISNCSDRYLTYKLEKEGGILSVEHASDKSGEDLGTDISTGHSGGYSGGNSGWDYGDDDSDFPLGPTVGGTIGVVTFITIIRKIAKKNKPDTSSKKRTPPQKGTSPKKTTKPKKEEPIEEPKKEKEIKPKKSKFLMVVYKDFGNGLRPGDPPRKIGARIEERTAEGEVRNRDDLTRTITISASENLSLSKIGLESPYQMANVSVINTSGTEGTVDFHISHLGIYFQKTLIFDILGEPEILFKNEEGWIPRYDYDSIFGAKVKETVLFTIQNAATDPKAIQLDYDHGSFHIEIRESEYEHSYYLDITNITPERPYSPLYENEQKEIFITCVFENNLEVKQSVRCNMVPYGLTFASGSLKKGRIYVDTKKVTNPKGLDPEFKSSRFDLHLAYFDNMKGKTEVYIPSFTECELTISKLRRDGAELDDFNKKYQYEIESDRKDGICVFTPKAALANMGEPTNLELLIQCEHRGNFYQLEVPLSIDGDKPPKRLSNWDTEYKLLKEAVLKYGLTPNGQAQNWLRHAKCMTANELCAVRRAVYAECCLYYSQESVEMLTIAQHYDRLIFVCNVAKFFGDQAFAFLAKRFTGEVGEAFLSPTKDLLVLWIGEAFASGIYDGVQSTVGIQFVFKIEEGCRKQVVDMILKGKVTDYKKVTALISTILYLNIMHHYYDKEDDAYNDLYKAVLSGFVDLSFDFIMGKIGDFLHAAAKEGQIDQKKISSAVKYVVEKVPKPLKKPIKIVGEDISKQAGLVEDLYHNLDESYIYTFHKKEWEYVLHEEVTDHFRDQIVDKLAEGAKLSPDQAAKFDKQSEFIETILLLFDGSVQPGVAAENLISFTYNGIEFFVTAPFRFFYALCSSMLQLIFSPITTMLPERPKQTFDGTCNYYFPEGETELVKYGIGADDDYHYNRGEE